MTDSDNSVKHILDDSERNELAEKISNGEIKDVFVIWIDKDGDLNWATNMSITLRVGALKITQDDQFFYLDQQRIDRYESGEDKSK